MRLRRYLILVTLIVLPASSEARQSTRSSYPAIEKAPRSGEKSPPKPGRTKRAMPADTPRRLTLTLERTALHPHR